jgi:multimeric flavodoxin WrbA
MKVVAINGSPNPKGNTATLLKLMAEELDKEGIETQIIQVGAN